MAFRVNNQRRLLIDPSGNSRPMNAPTSMAPIKPLPFKAIEHIKKSTDSSPQTLSGTKGLVASAPSLLKEASGVKKSLAGLKEAKTALGLKETALLAGDKTQLAGMKDAKDLVKDAKGATVAGVAGLALNVAGSVVKDKTAKAVLTGAGKGASLGMTVGGPVGAAVGAAVFGVAGAVKAKKEEREAKEAERKETLALAEANKKIDAANKLGQAKYGESQRLYAYQNAGQPSPQYFDEGGELILPTYKVKPSSKLILVSSKKKIPVFKLGGKVNFDKENVILDGPSHDEVNSTGVKGDKGIPVVGAKREKVAEIESEELVLNTGAMTAIDALRKKIKAGDTKALKKLGKLIKKELKENTHDYRELED